MKDLRKSIGAKIGHRRRTIKTIRQAALCNIGRIKREITELEAKFKAARAAKYGVDQTTISQIVLRKTWKHI